MGTGLTGFSGSSPGGVGVSIGIPVGDGFGSDGCGVFVGLGVGITVGLVVGDANGSGPGVMVNVGAAVRIPSLETVVAKIPDIDISAIAVDSAMFLSILTPLINR